MHATRVQHSLPLRQLRGRLKGEQFGLLVAVGDQQSLCVLVMALALHLNPALVQGNLEHKLTERIWLGKVQDGVLGQHTTPALPLAEGSLAKHQSTDIHFFRRWHGMLHFLLLLALGFCRLHLYLGHLCWFRNTTLLNGNIFYRMCLVLKDMTYH